VTVDSSVNTLSYGGPDNKEPPSEIPGSPQVSPRSGNGV